MILRTVNDFAPFSPKERELVGARDALMRAPGDRTCPAGATVDNTVRAELIVVLALEAATSDAASKPTLVLSDARITGQLNFCSVRIERSLRFVRCGFAEAPDFCDAHIQGSAQFVECELPGMNGNRICTTGAFDIAKSTVTGPVLLRGAKIGAGLDFDGTSVLVNGKSAVSARGMSVAGDAFFRHHFNATGTVDLSKAMIEGGFYAQGAVFDGRGAIALRADGAALGGISAQKMSVTGEVTLTGATVKGELNLDGSTLVNNEGDALAADRIVVSGALSLADGFESIGTVRFGGARIGGEVSFDTAKLTASVDACLLAEDAIIEGDLRFVDGFSASGEVLLSGLRVGGDLSIFESRFDRAYGETIVAKGISVKHSFQLRLMKAPLCRVSFEGSEFGRLVDDEASWGDELELNGLKYGSFAGDAPTNAAARLRWLDKQSPAHSGKEKGGFRPQPWHQLRRTLLEMGHFEDAREVGIAYEERLRTAGLIGQSPQARGPALAWLNRTFAVGAHWLFGLLIGYGYRPAKLVAWLVSVWLLSGVLYWYAALDGVMAPSNPIVFQNAGYEQCQGDVEGGWYLCSKLPEEYTGFSPLAYSLDVLLPFVDLQQENDWAPKVPTPQASWYLELKAFSLKHAVRLALWFEIIFGWIAGVLLVAVVSGLTKRADE